MTQIQSVTVTRVTVLYEEGHFEQQLIKDTDGESLILHQIQAL